MTAERAIWVDYAKAIGITFVVYGHVARGLHNSGIPNYSEQIHSLIDSSIYSFHMPLFFFISGLFFVSSLKKRGPWQQVLNKISTLFYPYLIWSISQGSIEAVLSDYTNRNITLFHLFSILWRPIDQFWFLYALFLISLFGIVVYWKMSEKFYWLVVFVSLLLFIFQNNLKYFLLFSYINSYFIFFSLGVLFVDYYDHLKKLNYFILPFSLIFFSILQYVFHSTTYSFQSHYFYFFKFVLSFSAIVFICSFCIFLSIQKIQIRWLAYTGYCSFAIYVMHIVAGSGVRILMQKTLGIDNVYLHLILGTFFGIALPIFIIYKFEKKIGFLFRIPKPLLLKNE